MSGAIVFSCLSWVLGNILLRVGRIQNIQLSVFSKVVFCVVMVVNTLVLTNHIYQMDYISYLRYSDVVNWRANVLVKSMMIISSLLIFIGGFWGLLYTEPFTTSDVFKFMSQPALIFPLIFSLYR